MNHLRTDFFTFFVILAGYQAGNFIRFVSDVLNGVPSIVIGMAAYAIFVLRQGHFSAVAGGFALAIMMVPTIARSTEEMLLMVPHSIREAALGLGIPQWRSTLSITWLARWLSIPLFGDVGLALVLIVDRRSCNLRLRRARLQCPCRSYPPRPPCRRRRPSRHYR